MEILLVSDSCTIAEVLPPLISPHRLHTYHTGRNAVALLASLRPDVLILDLRLWDMPVFDVLHQSLYKPPHILALTDLMTLDVIDAAVAAGIRNMLLIPFSPDMITAYLDELENKNASPEA